MKIILPPELARYVRKKLTSGEFASANQFIESAVRVYRKLEKCCPSADDELRWVIQLGLDDIKASRVSAWNVDEAKARLRNLLRRRMREADQGKTIPFDAKVTAGIRRRGLKRLARMKPSNVDH
jgi:Arc/MetJ-type ribon-helix-helix transcriptional regulator